VGKIAEIVGVGATGNGLAGEYANSPHCRELRRAYSRIITVDEGWLGGLTKVMFTTKAGLRNVGDQHVPNLVFRTSNHTPVPLRQCSTYPDAVRLQCARVG